MCDPGGAEGVRPVHSEPEILWAVDVPQVQGQRLVCFVFTASEFTGELIDSPEGRLEWIPDDKLHDMNLWESDHIFFPWINEGKIFSAKFEYEGDEMRGYHVVFHSY